LNNLGTIFKERNNLKKIIIAAISKNGVIGSKGKTPWYSKSELNHFQKTTSGSPIIVGRVTFETLKKPLANRLNVIISRNKNLYYPFHEALIFSSLTKAYNYLERNNYEKVFICGGESIYKSAIKKADEMIISTMNFEIDGDKVFPKIDKKIWIPGKTIKRKEFNVEHYRRIKKSK
jgi:dihydrofolate reductase